ncbi:MAG: T9SS type A sorting domain-containing protein [Bacteroidales bacterium]|nr:T9SS type A sorting domain-containing protein [Bacteroidales bacterium]
MDSTYPGQELRERIHFYENHEPPYNFPPREIIVKIGDEWYRDTCYRSFPYMFPIIEPRCEAVEEVRVEWDSAGCLVATWDSLPYQEQWVVALNAGGGATLLDTVDSCRWHYCELPAGAQYELAVRSRCTNLKSYSWSPWHRPIDINVGISQAAAEASFRVSPNPTEGRVKVMPGEGFAGGRLEVLSVEGRRLEVHNLTAGTTLDLGGYAPGVYLLRLTTPLGTASRKVIVQRH